MSARWASSAVLTTSAAVGPAPTCACRAARRPGTRSRARGRRAAWRRRRCRARRRRPARSPRPRPGGRARRSGPRPGSAARRCGSASARPAARAAGIAVDAEHARVRRRRQDARAVAAGAERAVNAGARRPAAPAPAAPGEAARERGARSLSGHPRPVGRRASPSFPCSSLAAPIPRTRGGAPRRTACDARGPSRGRARGAPRSARAPTSGICCRGPRK